MYKLDLFPTLTLKKTCNLKGFQVNHLKSNLNTSSESETRTKKLDELCYPARGALGWQGRPGLVWMSPDVGLGRDSAVLFSVKRMLQPSIAWG